MPRQQGHQEEQGLSRWKKAALEFIHNTYVIILIAKQLLRRKWWQFVVDFLLSERLFVLRMVNFKKATLLKIDCQRNSNAIEPA